MQQLPDAGSESPMSTLMEAGLEVLLMLLLDGGLLGTGDGVTAESKITVLFS